MLPDKAKLEMIIKELQVIMRLQDWDIYLHLISQYEMKDIMKADHYDHIGCCERIPNQKIAHIKLNVDHSRIDENWYSTIVHEMLHIHTCVLNDIALNCMDNDDFVYKHFDYESEGLNITFEKIFVKIYPITNFRQILEGGGNDHGQSIVEVQ
jgi:hypothetical protein